MLLGVNGWPLLSLLCFCSSRSRHARSSSYSLARRCVSVTGIELHCVALHCVALHCMRCIALRYVALRCVTLHCIALYCVALYCITLSRHDNRSVSLCIAFHSLALHRHCIVLHCTAFRSIALHCMSSRHIRCITLHSHCIALHWIT